MQLTLTLTLAYPHTNRRPHFIITIKVDFLKVALHKTGGQLYFLTSNVY